MTHEDIQADLPAFALGAVDSVERREIEHHVPGCADCQRELSAWQEVVGVMALAGAEAEPPNLKPALLQRLQPRQRATVLTLRRWSLVPLAAAAAAILAVGVVREARWRTELTQKQQLADGLRTQLATAKDKLQQLTTELAAKENDVSALRAALASAQEALSVVQAPGLQLVRLKEAPKAPPGEGHVLMSRESGRALFYAFDLPRVPTDKVYELWWITEKEGPISAGLFEPDQRGLGRVETQLPPDAGAIRAAAVTIEPAGGQPKPTGPMVLLGDLPAES